MLFIINSKADENNIKYYSKDLGTLALMYHRFNENKYPSTNIQMDVFTKQINIIKDKRYEFENPKNFDLTFNKPKSKKKILLTIDDAFSSFYENAWPFLKKNKIPFILFVSTEPVGKNGYMTWDQIREVEKENFAFIGNHSHSHEYLLDLSFNDFKKDIDKSIKIFDEKLGYNSIFFSYPFGEYSLEQINYIKKKFKYAFGQHSGVIDFNKDIYELPRFPINEKYGDLKRFNFLIDLLPLQSKSILPIDKYIINNNPPKLIINFFNDQKNLKNINCFSDEGNNWEKSKVVFEKNKLIVNFREKFIFRRGRINCSLNDTDGWRWLGLQFSVKLN
ncbi:MAG: polysaccharide deacetylase [Pelagibacteraceae bacterium TMED268]|nr:MAG: polysaccharide deacetylase [Pelagibacteraceae bacterium TMED268]